MKVDACFKLLGTYLNFHIGQEEHMGKLISVRIDSNDMILVGVDEDGFVEEYEINKVHVQGNRETSKNLMKRIVKQVNRDINSFKYDLTEYRKDKAFKILESVDEESRTIILKSLDQSTSNNTYSIISQLNIPDGDKDFLCGIVAYKQRDAAMAYKVFSKRWLEDNNNLERCRDFLLVADEFDNDVLCFYLLKLFFRTAGRSLGDSYYLSLWWKFLYYATKYNNFDLLQEIEISTVNARILYDSFIYIFRIYNLDHLALRLMEQFKNGNNTVLQRNNEDFGNLEDAIDELSFCKHYLPENAEGYYLRFESCMSRILMDRTKSYDDLGEKSGYIYEYVKSRNYGFIIGNDFQQYFYHWEDITKTLQQRIINSIYSGKDIAFEDKIYVQFHAEIVNKRIRAMDII